MSDEAAGPGTQDPVQRAASTALRSARLRADVIRVAERVAQTQEMVAETLGRLASQDPHYASCLRAKSEAAEGYAARTRCLANDLQARGAAEYGSLL